MDKAKQLRLKPVERKRIAEIVGLRRDLILLGETAVVHRALEEWYQANAERHKPQQKKPLNSDVVVVESGENPAKLNRRGFGNFQAYSFEEEVPLLCNLY